MSQFNPLEYEKEILGFWKENDIHSKANKKNAGGKRFYFCDGPPYTSGKVHIGTAWNKSLKDSIIRYKRMNGFDVLDRAGYDMHGLPTENAAEKKLGIKSKDDIPKFGVDKFVKACKDLSIENMKIMNQDFTRLGVWMDFENAYQSVSREYISGVWWLVKKAHEKGRLYEGVRSMAWDWAHQTALAKHELEYKNVKDASIFVKMKVAHSKNEYLIIWTTTPWTIPFNLGIMANPKQQYVKCDVEGEVWIVAKAQAEKFIKGVAKKDYTILEEFSGEKLEGLEYIHPFHHELKEHYDRIKKESKNAHTVVLSEEFVDTSSGSGLVHMAPGCGPEDYEVGYRNGIKAWNLVKEDGHYDSSMGKFSGRHAIKENKSFTSDLEECGALVGKLTIEHQYPYGQRSHEPVIFRTTKQWFFKVEDIKEKMIAENDKIAWVPKAGYNAFNSWLENLRDNSISKQRYWGTPVPIWRNIEDQDDWFVVGSVDEAEKLSGKKIDEPHIPWIDEITIKKDGKIYKRVPDVLDVWVDAGCASWNSLDYPSRTDLFESSFPADFILEGKDQVRGWFNLLHIASMIAQDGPSFKAVYMHGFVQDALGRKMSKSLGNYIIPEEVVSKYGADTLRYYMIGGAAGGLDINYNFEDMKSKHKNLLVLWNLHKFVIEMASNLKKNPSEMRLDDLTLQMEERYILSKANSLLKKATEIYDSYLLDQTPKSPEELILDLSRVYIQLTREKASIGSDEEKEALLCVSYDVLLIALKIFAPTAPFITEKIYQNLKNEFGLGEESIHLLSWPKADESKIDSALESQMEIASQIIQASLGAREKMHRSVRWPIRSLVIATADQQVKSAALSLIEILKNQINVKEIIIKDELEGIKATVKPNFSALGPSFGENAAKIIAHLSSLSSETILNHLKMSGKYLLEIEGEQFEILESHLTKGREVPQKYEEAQFKAGYAYLDREVDLGLEGEGYSREIARRIQSLRKNAGLQKSNVIILHLKVDSELKGLLEGLGSEMGEKVGAKEIVIDDKAAPRQFAHSAKEKIKSKEIEIGFDIL